MKNPSIFQNAKHEWSSVRLMKLLIVIAILIVWVHSCLVSGDGTMTPIHPSILGLLFICMGIGSVEKYIEIMFGGSAPKAIKSFLKENIPQDVKEL